MPGGHGTDHRTRLVGLGDNPHLVLQAPAPPTLPPGDDLHHAIHQHTSTADLRSSLKRQEDQTQAAPGGGILDAEHGTGSKSMMRLSGPKPPAEAAMTTTPGRQAFSNCGTGPSL